MYRFDVWAPRANSLEVQVKGKKYAMRKDAKDWWRAEVNNAGTGDDYGYVLDGEKGPFPDPRSRWQPNGVHALSRIYDHTTFTWSDAGWQAPPLASGIVYELHIGTFTPEGTFDAAIEKLSYLRELGITHVELLPVNAFPGERGWGYDGVDLFAPQESYGGPDGLKRLVDACHYNGLAVLMDVVYNHFGPDGNYLGQYAPYTTPTHHTPWGEAVNFEDQGSEEVRRFFIDNAKMWLRDYHMDGLRLDAVHAYVDRSAVHFLEQLSAAISELEAEVGRHFVLIAESDLNDPRMVTTTEAGGYGMDAQWSDDFHHALVSLLANERGGYYSDFGKMEDLAKALKSVFVFGGRYSEYRKRWHGRGVEGLPGWKFLGYSQNHDQIGNSIQGQRLEHLVGPSRAKIAAALVLCSPFVPMLYQGEEFASSSPFIFFTDHNEELGKLVTEGRMKEFAGFGWDSRLVPDPQSEESFLRSKLKWDEVKKGTHKSMLDWYKALIELRRAHPELTNGRMDQVETIFDEHGQWIVMRRGAIAVVANLGKGTLRQPLSETEHATLLLGSEAGVQAESGHLVVPPDAVGVFGVKA